MTDAEPHDRQITRLLGRLAAGEPEAADDLLPLVYDRLRQLARGAARGADAAHTLQATALVHEAWMRLGGRDAIAWNNRSHFFGAAARAMRHLLVEQARRKQAGKRGGDRQQEPLDPDLAAPATAAGIDLPALDEALTRLEQEHPRPARIVTMRYFGGLEMAEIAELLEISDRSAQRDWALARSWLRRALDGEGGQTS